MASNELGTAFLSIIPKVDGSSMSSSFKTIEGHAEKSGTASGKGFGNALSVAAGTILGNVATMAGEALVGGVKSVVEGAFNNFGDYQQMVGSMEALFGDYSETVVRFAGNAFQETSMSANQYMETIASFSGALLKDLDQETAFRVADMALRDMADQASVYGKTVTEVSETYKSLARGNYQTLDNLFGGMFAGTKEGLRDMLDAAEAYQASLGNIVSYSEDSYADIVMALHDVSEMYGITGNAANEGAETLQGSIGIMQAAWDNFLTYLGTGDPQLIRESMDDLIAAAGVALDNALPVLQNIVTGFFGAMWDNLYESAPDGVTSVMDKVTEVFQQGVDMVMAIWDTFGPYLIESIGPILDTLGTVIGGALDIIGGIFSVITAVINGDWETAWSSIQDILSTAMDVVVNVIHNGFSVVTTIFGGVRDAVVNIFSNAGEWLMSAGRAIIDGFLNGLKAAWGAVTDFFSWATSMIPNLKGPLDVDRMLLYDNGRVIMSGLKQGLDTGWMDVERDLRNKTVEVSAIGHAAVETTHVGKYRDGSGSDSALVKEIRGLREDLTNIGVYVDGKRLASAMASHNDVALGMLSTRRSR